MKRKKALFIALALTFVYLFGSLFVTCALTGWRDIPDFTAADKEIFRVFVILEAAAFLLAIAIVFAIDRANRKEDLLNRRPPLNPYEKTIVTRDGLLLGASFLIVTVMTLIGALTLDPASNYSTLLLFDFLLTGDILLLGLFNVVAIKIFAKRLNKKGRVAITTFIYSHRDHAEQSARALSKNLRILLSATHVYTVILAILGIALAITSAGNIPFVLAAAFIIYSAFSRIYFPTPKQFFSEDNGYVAKSELPELYTLAEEAAQAVGVTGEIKICLLSSFDAGIRRFGKAISVQIGAPLYDLMSREELRSILLHEFAHLGIDTEDFRILYKHNCNLSEGRPQRSLYNVSALLYSLFDGLFGFNFMLYTYASTVGEEEKADRAMVKYGAVRYAGSSFLKIKYHDLYQWEKGSYNTTPIYADEILTANLVKNEIKAFKEQISMRRDFWNKLIDLEIIARSASHPTIKMRLDAIGHTDYSLHESEDTDSYKNEQKKAIEYIDGKIYDQRKYSYEDERKEAYLDPLNTVKEWEESGKAIIPDSYRTVIFALRQLGRITEANELCDRVIDSLPVSASHYAYYMKGCTLLHSFDESGIEYLYRAIEANHNYIDEGMETIGQFCCISGRQDDLDTYRERVIQMAQEQDDKYSELSHISQKDNLTSEQLPKDIYNGLLSIIEDNRDFLNEVYLVRKIITDDYFASVVVLDFISIVDDSTKWEIYDKFFLHLDSQDWDFTLFVSEDVPMNVIKKIPSGKIYSRPNT